MLVVLPLTQQVEDDSQLAKTKLAAPFAGKLGPLHEVNGRRRAHLLCIEMGVAAKSREVEESDGLGAVCLFCPYSIEMHTAVRVLCLRGCTSVGRPSRSRPRRRPNRPESTCMS